MYIYIYYNYKSAILRLNKIEENKFTDYLFIIINCISLLVITYVDFIHVILHILEFNTINL